VLRAFIKRLTCKHPYPVFIRNVYGDEINLLGGKRSIWRCDQCGEKRVLRDDLRPDAAPDPLREMEARKDAAYLERNQVVAALAKAYPSGVARTAIEGWAEDWHGCVYIDLPTGQASWHFHDSQAYLFADLPPYTGKWDGHDTPEKYRRLAALPVKHLAA